MLARDRTQAARTMRLLLPLLLHVGASGSDPIRGPEEVSGMERSSLTVWCHYDPEWETYRKWWCRGGTRGSCKILIQTTESEWKMRKGRVSIVDSQRSRVFIVTMEELRPDDADVYWCGIARTGVDFAFPVKVTIRPAFATTAATTTTITTTVFTAPVTPEGTTGSPTVSSHHSVDGPLLSNVRFLLLVFLEVPLFLAMLGAVLWVNRPQSSGGRPSQPAHEAR